MKQRPGTLTLILFSVTVVVLLISVPGSLREALARGNFYVFTHDFFAHLPRRLAGPGRFRFVIQPLIATILGIRSGRVDARMGLPPYLIGVFFDRRSRAALLKSSFNEIVNLILSGILIDSICQWLILGASYPGAALVVGPLLIAAPYCVARAVSNRYKLRPRGDVNSHDKSAGLSK